MQQYKEFETMIDGCLGEDNIDTEVRSKWIIRMEMNSEAMLDKNITMDDINFAIKNAYREQVDCVFSDYNSEELVFRLRLANVSNSKKRVLLSKML